MASKTVLMSAFFEQLSTFLTELSAMYPDDSDFSLFSTTITMMKMTNPSMVVKYVNDNVQPYEDKILAHNEDFFLGHSFEEYSSQVDMNIFGKLKDYIVNMSPDSKASVWKYIENIMKLAKMIR